MATNDPLNQTTTGTQQPQGSPGAYNAPAALPTGGQIDSALSGTQPQVNPAGGAIGSTGIPPDPFEAMGGGVFVNGGWVPKSHPAAQQAVSGAPAPQPAAAPAAQPMAAPAPSNDPFAAIGGGFQLPDGGWVPLSHPLAQQGQQMASSSQPVSGMGGSFQGTSTTTMPTELMAALRQIIGRGEGGGLSQDIVQGRVESAREAMDRGRSSQMDTLSAALSERGLLGSGPEATGLGNIEQELAEIFGGQVRDIYGDEAQRADERFMGALGLMKGREDTLSGVSSANRGQDIQRELGLAGIESDYLLGQGGLDLSRELGLLGQQGQQDDLMLELMRLFQTGASNTQQGYQK